MCEKEILIKRLTETLNKKKAKQKWQRDPRQTRKYQSCQSIPLDTRNRFASHQNNQDKVLDKEAKNYKEKKKYYNTVIKHQYIESKIIDLTPS